MAGGLKRKVCHIMAYGRLEIAPAEQIKALRHARDQYVELADRIHGDTDPALDATERQQREDDARRIAKAYDRSLSNSVARLSGMERTHRITTKSFGLWYRIGIVLILASACLLPFAYRDTPALKGFANIREIAANILNSAPAPKAPPAEIPPPVVTEQTALPEEPEAPQTMKLEAQKPAAALAAPAPRKIAQPRPAAAKKAVVDRPETTPAKPAAPKPVVQTPPEVAKAATPAPAEPLPPALVSAPVAPAAALPAPVAPIAPPAPPVATVVTPPASFHPQSMAETHTLPRYPPISERVGETGTTKMIVAITPQGRAADCRITQSSGSDRLDRAACAHVTDQWRWKPFSRDSAAPAPRTGVTIVWKLLKPTPGR